MSDLTTCASCANTQSLKQCARCKLVSYCSTACQRAHWQNHKPSCHFKVTLPSPSQNIAPTDALSILRSMPNPGIKQNLTRGRKVAQRIFDIPELRLAIFSLLPASDLLRSQRVCRSWYLITALEQKLQQRMFFVAGPGELIFPARSGNTIYPALHPYNSSQRGALSLDKDIETRHGGVAPYLFKATDGTMKELLAVDVEKAGARVILNPFLTRIWPQHPENMTLLPAMHASKRSTRNSWRRTQLTSPPISSLSMDLWFTKRHATGHQLVPSTGRVPSGVTLGHLADMLAAQPKKLEFHWMQPHGYASWVRSADAVVLLEEGDVEHSEGNRGVYVNPSNGSGVEKALMLSVSRRVGGISSVLHGSRNTESALALDR